MKQPTKQQLAGSSFPSSFLLCGSRLPGLGAWTTHDRHPAARPPRAPWAAARATIARFKEDPACVRKCGSVSVQTDGHAAWELLYIVKEQSHSIISCQIIVQ